MMQYLTQKYKKYYIMNLEIDQIIALFDNNKQLPILYEKSFIEICEKGRLDIAQHVYMNNNNMYINLINKKLFRISCKNGHLELAKWIYSIYKQKDKIKVASTINTSIIECCVIGQIDVVTWLCTLEGSNIHIDNDTPFIRSCENGHLELAKWIHSKGVNISRKKQEQIFYDVCINGHSIELAKWIYTLFELEIREYPDPISFIGTICSYGHTEIVKWIYELDRDLIIYHITGYRGYFYTACFNGHYDLAKWLYTLSDHESSLDSLMNLTLWILYKKHDDKLVVWLYDTFDLEFIEHEYGWRYSFIKRNKDFHKAIKNNCIDELYKDVAMKELDDVCSSCLTDAEIENKWVQLKECQHILCVDCYAQQSKCPFGCFINYSKINLFKS